MEEYTTLVQEMATSSRISMSRVDSLPSGSTSYYSALSLPYQMAWPCPQECHVQWRLPSVVLRDHSPLQTYMFCLVPSSHLSHTVIRSFKSHSYNHTFMHLHTNTSIYSHIQAYTTHTYTHNINSHMIALVAQNLVWSYLINSAISSCLSSGKSYITDNLKCIFVFVSSGKSYITDSLRFVFVFLPSGKSYITDSLRFIFLSFKW